MSCRSSGYSNAAYCSMYDPDDDQESFWVYEDRETPLGASGSLRHTESPATTPRKVQRTRQRSFSAPRNTASNTANVLAPMIAQARVAGAVMGTGTAGIRRSRSAVFTEERRMSLSSDLSQRGTPCRRTVQSHRGYRINHRPQETPSLSSWDLQPQTRQPLLPQNRNLAVIPPNTRPPPRPSPLPPSPTKVSWTVLPGSSPTPTNTLFLSGLFLLFASTANCLLCFYLLAKKGRHYYIDLAVVSGFAMLVLGYTAVRTGRWDWVFNRNYLAGYMVLSMLDVLLCGVLGLLASDWRPPDMPEVVEIASGAVCGLSALMLLLALFLCGSSCCRHPPPDNRVSHSVPSLIV